VLASIFCTFSVPGLQVSCRLTAASRATEAEAEAGELAPTDGRVEAVAGEATEAAVSSGPQGANTKSRKVYQLIFVFGYNPCNVFFLSVFSVFFIFFFYFFLFYRYRLNIPVESISKLLPVN
jgi:hypothetical protein